MSYLAGMEDGLFPSYMSIMSDNAAEEIEEERQFSLCRNYKGKGKSFYQLCQTADDTWRNTV